VRVEAEIAQHCPAILEQAQVDEVVDQRSANEELERQVIQPLGVGFVVAMFGGEPAGNHAIAHDQGDGAKRLARRQALDVFTQKSIQRVIFSQPRTWEESVVVEPNGQNSVNFAISVK